MIKNQNNEQVIMVGQDSDLDLKKIDFPSDNLRVKDLRRLHPHNIDARDHDSHFKLGEGSVYDKLVDLINSERCLAINTYDESRKMHRDFGLYGEDLEGVRQDLVRSYIDYGIASGPAHAEQLIRSIESQALRQAERHDGKSR
jgi:hypothetical protein